MRYAAAEAYARRALAIRERVLGAEHPDTARSLFRLAVLRGAQRRPADGLPLARRALSIQERVLGSDHPETANALSVLAALLRDPDLDRFTNDRNDNGRLAESELLEERAKSIRERALGPGHSKTAEGLFRLAPFYWTQKRYGEAEALARRALEIQERVLEPEHPSTARSLHMLAAQHNGQKRYADAERAARRALEIRERLFGPTHSQTEDSRRVLAQSLLGLHGPAGAEAVAKRLLEEQTTRPGAANPETVGSFLLLTSLYRQLGRPLDAVPLGKGLLAAAQGQGVRENPALVPALDRMADLYADDYAWRASNKAGPAEKAVAEALLKLALQLREMVLGPEYPEIAERLDKLANLNSQELRLSFDRQPRPERVEETEQLYRRAAATEEKRNGLEHETTISRFKALAEFYSSQRQYSKAAEAYKRVLPAAERVFGPEHSETVNIIAALAGSYKNLGHYTEAEKFYLWEFAIREKKFSPGEATFYSLVSSGLEAIYTQQHRIPDLEALHKRHLAAAERAPGSEGKLLDPLWQLGQFYYKHERDLEAGNIYKRALELAEKASGHKQFNLVTSLKTLAELYEESGRDAEAEPLLGRLLKIAEATDGPEHSDTISRVKTLAKFYANLDRDDEAIPLYQRVIAAGERLAREDSRRHPWSSFTMSVNALADFHKSRGRFAEAEALLKRALAMAEDRLLAAKDSLDHLTDVNILYSSLFVLYRDSHRPVEQQESIFKDRLELHERIFGKDDLKLARPLEALANFHNQHGKHHNAEQLYRRAKALRERNQAPDHGETLGSLSMLAATLLSQKRGGETEDMFKRLLAAAEKDAAPAVNWVSRYNHALHNLVKLYQGLGRLTEIEPLYQRAAILIREKALGPANDKLVEILNHVAQLYFEHGRLPEAVQAAERSLALTEAAGGPEPALLKPLGNLIAVYRDQGRTSDAARLAHRALAIAERHVTPGKLELIRAIDQVGMVHRQQRRYSEAEAHYHRALDIAEAERAKRAVLSRKSSRAGAHLYVREIQGLLNNLGVLYTAQQQYQSAEKRYRRALELADGSPFKPDLSPFMTSLQGLGSLYSEQGRYDEAEPLLKRALDACEAICGRGHPNAALMQHELANVHSGQGRHDDAEALLKQALETFERAYGPRHQWVASALESIGRHLVKQKRHDEAEPLLQRALAINEQVFASDHPQVAQSLNALVHLRIAQKRDADALQLARRMLAIVQKTRGPEHPWTAISLSILASLHERRGELTEAHRLSRQAADALIHRLRRGLGADGRFDGNEFGRHSNILLGHVRASLRLARDAPDRSQSLIEEAFESAQWAQRSEAGRALAQMAARFSAGNDALAGLVRQREALAARLGAVDKDLVTVASNVHEVSHRPERKHDLIKEREEIERQLTKDDATLRERFPDYAALVNPEPMSIAEVRRRLRPDEAAYTITISKDEAYAWVVTHDAVRAEILPITEEALTEVVNALRCGLDAEAWALHTPPRRCASLLGLTATTPGNDAPLPFHLGKAHALYRTLFGPVEHLIAGKRLLVVPSGPLTSLPFHVLVTERPEDELPKTFEGYRGVAWLGRRQAIAILPTVSSLNAMRRVGRPSAAARAMIGFGNPLLDGNPNDAAEATRAKLARERRHCSELPTQRTVARVDARSGVQRMEMRGGLANLAHLRAQAPLPETADELCAVAHDVKADVARDIRLGSQATEQELKRLSASGELAKYRLVHFATHGTLAGELKGTHEPGLILTPPETATEDDDGYLSASFIVP